LPKSLGDGSINHLDIKGAASDDGSLPTKLRASAGGYVVATLFPGLILGLFAWIKLTRPDADGGWGVIVFVIGVMLFLYLCLWQLQLTVERRVIRYRSLFRRFEIPFSSIDRVEFLAPKIERPASVGRF